MGGTALPRPGGVSLEGARRGAQPSGRYDPRMSEQLSRDLAQMGIYDARVLRAMAETPRRLFVPEHLGARADGDHPLPIGFGQTISQPFMVAWMTQALELGGTERVLEIGAGSGYQAAVLGRLCRQVISVELIPALARRAREILAALRIENVEVRVGDGSRGLPDEGPFDRIIVSAAAASIPPALIAQLCLEGRMVIPVGAAEEIQHLHVVDRGADGRVEDRRLFAVRFVPLRSAEDGVALDSHR
jgi:protein-L-isoaspartate(D-aspartate) O-methyltransferase